MKMNVKSMLCYVMLYCAGKRERERERERESVREKKKIIIIIK